MTSTIKHKGYTGRVEFDAEEMTFFGEVIGLKDVITFRGKTPEEIVDSFHRSVDAYLEFCKEQKQNPEKPFSGKIPFRTSSENHYNIYIAAHLEDKSINAWMNDTLAEAAQRTIVTAEGGAVLPFSEEEIAAELPAHRPISGVTLETDKETIEELVSAMPSFVNLPGPRYSAVPIGDIVAEVAQKIARENTPVSRSKIDAIVAETMQQAATKTTKESAPASTSYFVAPVTQKVLPTTRTVKESVETAAPTTSYLVTPVQSGLSSSTPSRLTRESGKALRAARKGTPNR